MTFTANVPTIKEKAIASCVTCYFEVPDLGQHGKIYFSGEMIFLHGNAPGNAL